MLDYDSYDSYERHEKHDDWDMYYFCNLLPGALFDSLEAILEACALHYESAQFDGPFFTTIYRQFVAPNSRDPHACVDDDVIEAECEIKIDCDQDGNAIVTIED